VDGRLVTREWERLTLLPIRGNLPSNLPGVFFTYRMKLLRRVRDTDPRDSASIQHRVYLQLSRITQRWTVEEVHAAEMEVNGTLGPGLRMSSSSRTLVRGSAKLRVSRKSHRAAAEYNTKLRDARLRAEAEVEHLRFLRDQVFGSPGLAPLWWAKEQPGQLAALRSEDFRHLQDAAMVSILEPSREEDLVLSFRRIISDPAHRDAALRILALVSASVNQHTERTINDGQGASAES